MYRNNDLDWIKELSGKTLYLFGAGHIGKKVLFEALSEGFKVAGFIDNNPDKQNERINGMPVVTFDKFLEEKDDDCFVIISSNFGAEIKKQLMRHRFYSFVDYTQIDFSGNGEEFYNESYFEWQIKMARIDSQIDAPFFQQYIKANDTVCEFGCGGGLLLEKIECSKKIGIDINPVAREYAKSLGVETLDSVEKLDDGSIDVFISSHALEHVLRPYEILVEIKEKLKSGGLIIFVVPYDSIYEEYDRQDESHHIFTWNQRNLGNLFKVAGFFVKEVGLRESVWPDNWENIFNEVGINTFKAIATLESSRTANFSSYVVAIK